MTPDRVREGRHRSAPTNLHLARGATPELVGRLREGRVPARVCFPSLNALLDEPEAGIDVAL